MPEFCCKKCEVLKDDSLFVQKNGKRANCVCNACRAKQAQIRYKSDPDFRQKELDYSKEYRVANKIKVAEANLDWRVKNKDRHSKVKQIWHQKNRSEILKYLKVWRENNKAVMIAHNKRRKLAKINRTPIWSDLKAISNFYNNCPQGYHVDHVIPLRGKLVSGLHVLNNLQYLPALDNLSKNNKFNPLEFDANVF